MHRTVTSVLMQVLPVDIIGEVVSWLTPEETEILRITSLWFYNNIRPQQASLANYGAGANSVEIYLMGVHRKECTEWVCHSAAIEGHLNMLIRARDDGHRYRPMCMVEEVTARGYLHILREIWNTNNCAGVPVLKNVIYADTSKLRDCIIMTASFCGHMHIIEWVIEIDHKIYGRHVDNLSNLCSAAAGDRLDVVKYFLELGYAPGHGVVEQFARRGNLHAMEYLIHEGFNWSSDTCYYAALHGHKHILEWAVDNWYVCGPDDFYGAAKNGHLEVLAWMHDLFPSVLMSADDNGRSIISSVSEVSAEEGHLHVLQWIVDNEYPLDELTFSAATDHLNVLEWLYDRDCPRDEQVCSTAATRGNLEAIIWARSKGFPWDEWTYINAKESDNTTIIEWLYANDYPWIIGVLTDSLDYSYTDSDEDDHMVYDSDDRVADFD